MLEKNEAGFIRSLEPEPHRLRRRQILDSHPEVRALVGPATSSVLFIFGIVSLQLVVAFLLRQAPWWLLLPTAYIVGAVANNALFILIHECTHNLAWKGTRGNRILAIIANVAIVFPVAISFRKYHLLHHKYQGELALDADLPSPIEARLVGNSPVRKAIWLLFFFLVEAFRPVRIKSVRLLDGWTLANVAAMVLVIVAVVAFAGWQALLYLMLSTIFGVGLHPLGARWIQEHFVMRPGQETYSYYGRGNRLAFNVGYHYEHHDLMTVPWTRLPRLRALAPEFYEGLHSHRSWTRLLFQFLFDRRMTLQSRVVRPSSVADVTITGSDRSVGTEPVAGDGVPVGPAASVGTSALPAG